MSCFLFSRFPRVPPSASLVALVAFSITSAAQTLPPDWQARYDGPGHIDDYGTSVAVMSSGEIAVGGFAFVEAQPGYFVPQFFTALYSPAGVELWSRLHGSGFYGGNGAADKIAIAPGNKIVTAGTRDLGADWMVVQYDAAGNQEWEGLWLAGSYFVSSLLDLDVDGSGNIYVCGELPAGTGVAKFSSTGALLWSRVYTGTGQDLGSIRALAVNGAGDLFMTGRTATTGGGSQFSVARIDPASGTPIWIRAHGPASGSDSFGMGLCTNGAGNAIAGGHVADPLSGGAFLSFVSYAPDGTLVWSYDHNGSTAISGTIEDMAVDPAGRLAVAGWKIMTLPDVDGFVLCLNGGAFAWEASLEGSAHLDDRAISVALDSVGQVYVGAYLREPDLGFDAFQYSPTGTLVAHGRSPVPASGSGYARDMAITPAGNAYVAGNMASFPGTGGDAVTVAFEFGLPASSAFCFGDGSGAACPCGNASSPGANVGCLNSLGVGGRLVGVGTASLGSDTLTLHGSQMPNSSALYLQGTAQVNGGLGVVFGDGLRCVGGNVIRLGLKANVGGASQYPASGDPSVSVRGLVTAPGTRAYQIWYRNSAPYCTAASFNLSNGVSVSWTP